MSESGMMCMIDNSPRPASGALTKTGGFLKGFTHTLQPYIGCRFGCEYCYVKDLSVHHFHTPRLPWGQYAHPRLGIDQLLRKELKRHANMGRLDGLAIYMSSATDPYQFQEKKWRLTRACLETFIDYPPGLLVVQTRSPFVRDDLEYLRQLGKRCWLNFTLETDRDDVRRQVTPLCPSIAQRLSTLKQALEAQVNVQITVSPCLPYTSAETFGQLLLEHSHRVIVDSFVSGDGRKGQRTSSTAIPALYEDQNWGEWSSEDAAFVLYRWLHERRGPATGWSQEGFTTLAANLTTSSRPQSCHS